MVQGLVLQEGSRGHRDRDTSPVPPATAQLQAPQERPVLVLKCRHLLTFQPKMMNLPQMIQIPLHLIAYQPPMHLEFLPGALSGFILSCWGLRCSLSPAKHPHPPGLRAGKGSDFRPSFLAGRVSSEQALATLLCVQN